MCIFGGGGGARAAEKLQQQQADEATADAQKKANALQVGMGNINTAFSGFDDNYFSGLAKNYTDYAMPQLQDQYDLAKKDITYSLARKGDLASTTAGDQQALLDKQNARNIVGVEGAGADVANQARRDVQANKQDVISQLNTTYDAGSANDMALSAAKSLAVPKSFSPIGQLFTNVSALAAQSKLASDGSTPGVYPYGGNTGAQIYGGGSASTLVTG